MGLQQEAEHNIKQTTIRYGERKRLQNSASRETDLGQRNAFRLEGIFEATDVHAAYKNRVFVIIIFFILLLIVNSRVSSKSQDLTSQHLSPVSNPCECMQTTVTDLWSTSIYTDCGGTRAGDHAWILALPFHSKAVALLPPRQQSASVGGAC